MVITDFCNGLIMLIIATAMITGALTLPTLYSLLVCSAIATALFNPSANSSIPLLVEEKLLPKANALNQLSTQGSNIFGPTLAGILIGSVGNVGFLLLVSGIAFILSALTEMWIKVPRINEEDEKLQFIMKMKEALKYVTGNRELLLLVIVGGTIINFLLAPLPIFVTYMSESIFDVGAAGLGIISSSLAVGALCGSFMIMFNIFKNKYKMAVIGLIIEGFALLIMGIVFHYYATIVAVWVLGVGICLASVGLNTLYQTMIPKVMMGRVLSLVSMLLGVSIPLGQLFGSIIITYYAISTVLIVFSIIVIISAISLIRLTMTNKNKKELVLEEGAN